MEPDRSVIGSLMGQGQKQVQRAGRGNGAGERSEPLTHAGQQPRALPVQPRFRSPVYAPLLIALVALTTLSLTASTAMAGEPYRFDDAGYLGKAELMPDWADTMRREAEQAPILDACLTDPNGCPPHYRGLRHLLEKAAELPQKRQVSLVSHYVNRKRYRDDRTAHLESPLAATEVKYRSRWSTVEEFMRRGGDCEDFATTKYYLLRRLGFRTDQLRVVVTWDRGARGYHAILAVKLDEADTVLLLESDNTIRRGSRHRYRFIYSINEESIWDHEAAPASVSRQPPASRNKEISA